MDRYVCVCAYPTQTLQHYQLFDTLCWSCHDWRKQPIVAWWFELLIEMLETLHGDILQLSFQSQCDHRLSLDYIGLWIEVKLYNDIWIRSWDFIGAYFERWLGGPHLVLKAPLAARCLDRHVGNAIRGVVPGPSVDPVHQVLYYGLDLRFCFSFFRIKKWWSRHR